MYFYIATLNTQVKEEGYGMKRDKQVNSTYWMLFLLPHLKMRNMLECLFVWHPATDLWEYVDGQ